MSSEYCDYVVDALSSWHPVTAKRMFGGYGLYREGLIFGIIAYDTLFLKVDDSNLGDYHAIHSRPFSYEAKGKEISINSYWMIPEDILESPELKDWAEKSYQVARTQPPKKRSATKTKAAQSALK